MVKSKEMGKRTKENKLKTKVTGCIDIAFAYLKSICVILDYC